MNQPHNFKKYQQILLRLRSEIIEKFESEINILEKEQKQTSGDEIDIASEQRDIDFNHLISQRDKQKLDRIQNALEKIESGDFGICEECGDEISEKRLGALPYTTLCVDCQEKNEGLPANIAY